MNRQFPITILRVFCLAQIFVLHYFAGHGLREYMWLFSIAVPIFLIVSAFLYGLKRENNKALKFTFIKKRYLSLSLVYYPFVIVVLLYYLFADPINKITYLKSGIGAILYFTSFITPLPGCGHLWFMQTIMLCYITLYICSNFNFIEKCFKSVGISLIIFIVVILIGFLYRGPNIVYLFFYLWTYYNAQWINKLSGNKVMYAMVILLILGYYLLSLHYEEIFKTGIYIKYIQTCVMALATIKLFTLWFKGIKDIKVITFLGTISMEIYLIHHLFVFDHPLYWSLAVTIVFSIILHQLSVRLKSYYLPL